jgi:hypothetical protein
MIQKNDRPRGNDEEDLGVCQAAGHRDKELIIGPANAGLF